jgi:hypothetical protein
MTNGSSTASPRLRTRLASVLYLTTVAAAVLVLSVCSALVVRASPARTAADMVTAGLAHPSALAAELIGTTRQIGTMALHRRCSAS